jgi:hypothetical protein
MSSASVAAAPAAPQKLEKKPIKFSNLLLGAGLNMFEVTTLGQPLEVTKTTMAAHRGDSFASAIRRIWSRGGILGCTYFFCFFCFHVALFKCLAFFSPASCLGVACVTCQRQR